ncbi:phospholipid-transporting ATPase ABCA1-like isoform X2 [Adelges cooleyi]|uniref:phospholipid-transporting ATPase ABCA1-like isoform X2 n=1 Tax=Adelges cooleyi TaxID=133065 RepID=UPI00217FB270|nr:phospholipid-transporting ATPase ABCA1-like isoform X2 [Adelges cooleyi]
MPNNFNKLKLLLWKNLMIQRRRSLQSAFEMFLPAVIAFVMIFLRTWVRPVEFNEPTRYPAFSITAPPIITNYTDRWTIAWSPYNPALELIMIAAFAKISMLKLRSFNDCAEMENNLNRDRKMKTYLSGVCFDNVLPNSTSVPKNIVIKLRYPCQLRVTKKSLMSFDTVEANWKTYLSFPLYQTLGPRHKEEISGGEPGYVAESFLYVQSLISEAFVTYWSPDKCIPKIQMQRFSYPNYKFDPLLTALSSFVSILVMFSYVYTAISTIKMIVSEKESKLKETMMLMGLDNWLIATAWYLKSFVVWMIPLFVIVLFVTYNWPATEGNRCSEMFMLLIVLTPFVTSSISYCFLVAACFKKANTAAAVGGVLWFVTFTPYMISQPKYTAISSRYILLSTVLPNTALGYIFQSFIMLKGIGKDLSWTTIASPITPDDKCSIANVMTMLVVDTVLYLTIALYTEIAFPAHGGYRPPWYYPIQLSYWFGQKQSNTDVGPGKSGIQIQSLTKYYGNCDQPVVDSLTVDMYPNQITVLLGHNGAGKSTTMSMLSGLIRPSSGSALIEGRDINTQMKTIRSSLGLCPQYNLLFPDLTVIEHLKFFGVLKDLSNEALNDEIQKYIVKFKLESMLNTKAEHLSGGMKRKLSVAIALIGKSKVVLMDEPTSGMDPIARRTLWNILQSEREGRTIVMTTHLMDEADLLGDRVVIMKTGKLCCVGTPFSLKKKYGGGYNLTLIMDKATFDVNGTTMFIQNHFPNVIPGRITPVEVTYKLPESGLIPELLNTLEKNKSCLGIKEYGITFIRLDDVYEKFSNHDGQLPYQNSSHIKFTSDSCVYEKNRLHLKANRATGWKLFAIQLQALMVKKYLQSSRALVLHSLQIALTVVFIFASFAVVFAWKSITDLPALAVSLDNFWKPVSTIMLASHERDVIDMYNSYKNACAPYPVLEVGGYNKSLEYFENFLLKIVTKNVPLYTQTYIVGAVFNRSTAVAYFNNKPYHGPPLSLNMVYNAILKSQCGEDCGIEIVNHPLPYQGMDRQLTLVGGSNLGFQVAFSCAVSQALVCALYVLYAVKERQSGVKLMQNIAGVKPTAYWIASLLWDWISYSLIIFTIVVALYVYGDPGYSDLKQTNSMLVLLAAFSWADLPLMSLFSYLFTEPSSSFSGVAIFNVITGAFGLMLVMILQVEPLCLKDQSRFIHSVLIYFPHYALSNGLKNIYAHHEYSEICQSYENATLCPVRGKINKGENSCLRGIVSPEIDRNVAHLFWFGLVNVLLLLSCEYLMRATSKTRDVLWNTLKDSIEKAVNADTNDSNNMSSSESDVQREKQTVHDSSYPQSFSVYLKNVGKNYGKKQAVMGMDLALRPNECFGLLGTNGAGKTTTFQMVTGDIKNSSGDIYVCGIHVNNNSQKIHEVAGYCPQFNGIIEELTGYESLYFFSRLRGMSKKEATDVSFHLASRLALIPYLNVQAKNYSGGNKRKLSAAMAMIGDPPVLFLDEPTSGMDPAARKNLWDFISEERDKGKCIFITTHGLEECEAVCTRLAIMVDGRISCIGSIQHLKNKYSDGYQLHVKFHPNNRKPAKEFIEVLFENYSISEQFESMSVFHIPEKYSCSFVFTQMEQAKRDMSIVDYSIQQTTLEQVFLNIIKNKNQAL